MKPFAWPRQLVFSQEELGFESELDRTYISGIERGVRNPTVETMSRLCRALGVRVSVLIARVLSHHAAERL